MKEWIVSLFLLTVIAAGYSTGDFPVKVESIAKAVAAVSFLVLLASAIYSAISERRHGPDVRA